MSSETQKIVSDAASMAAFAAEIANSTNIGDIITLRGDLGVGKTTFAKGFINSFFNTHQDVTSPTFTLMQNYITDYGIKILHCDLYRIERVDEIAELGIEDFFESCITLIEWPEIMDNILPKNRLDIYISYGKSDSERIVSCISV